MARYAVGIPILVIGFFNRKSQIQYTSLSSFVLNVVMKRIKLEDIGFTILPITPTTKTIVPIFDTDVEGEGYIGEVPSEISKVFPSDELIFTNQYPKAHYGSIYTGKDYTWELRTRHNNRILETEKIPVYYTQVTYAISVLTEVSAVHGGELLGLLNDILGTLKTEYLDWELSTYKVSPDSQNEMIILTRRSVNNKQEQN